MCVCGMMYPNRISVQVSIVLGNFFFSAFLACAICLFVAVDFVWFLYISEINREWVACKQCMCLCACAVVLFTAPLRYDTIPIRLLNVCMYAWFMYIHLAPQSLSLKESENPIGRRRISTASDQIACLQEIHYPLFWLCCFYEYIHNIYMPTEHTQCAALNIIAFDVHNYTIVACYCYALVYGCVCVCVSFQFAIAILNRFEYHYKNKLYVYLCFCPSLLLSFDNTYRALSFPLM